MIGKHGRGWQGAVIEEHGARVVILANMPCFGDIAPVVTQYRQK